MNVRSLAVAVALSFTILPAVSADTKPAAKTASTITLVGKLQKAVESTCQILREDKTNKVYSFKKSKYKDGTHVKVTAHAVDVSICQQGTPIAIDKIVKVK
jgi:hypothetical protein